MENQQICTSTFTGTERETTSNTGDIFVIASIAAFALVSAPASAGEAETAAFSKLADDFGTTVEELMAANNLTDANALQVGQTLLLPFHECQFGLFFGHLRFPLW